MKKGFFWNPVTCNYENGKYVGNIIGKSVVICDEIIDTVKPYPAKRTPIKTVPKKSTLTKIIPANFTVY